MRQWHRAVALVVADDRLPAPWRDTPGPTWELVAAMLRNQRRELVEKPLPPPAQQNLHFE